MPPRDQIRRLSPLPGARRRPRAPDHPWRLCWTKRYPWIAEAARKVRQKRFVLDGEAVILGVDGVSDFDALHVGKHNDEVQLCAFDVLVEGDNDLRRLPLHLRNFVNPFERGELGP